MHDCTLQASHANFYRLLNRSGRFGVGAQNTWVDGNKQGSVFTIASEATVFIRYMLIRNAKGPGIINWGKLTVKGVIVGANSEAGILNGTNPDHASRRAFSHF